MTVYAYTRVSKEEQAVQGVGLEAQADAIRIECERRGWEPTWESDPGVSSRSLKRPGMQRLLARLARGDTLLVAKLDRLTRSLTDFVDLIRLAEQGKWSIVVLDPVLDFTTPSGRAMAGMLAVFAQFEREMIGQRTKAALAVKRSQGVRLGRPCSVPPEVRERIHGARRRKLSYAAIAQGLNDDGIPTGQGGAKWWPSSVRAVAVSR